MKREEEEIIIIECFIIEVGKLLEFAPLIVLGLYVLSSRNYEHEDNEHCFKW